MKELGLVHHTVQFHSRFSSASNIRPPQLVSLVQLLERELNSGDNESKHRILLISDNLLHIDNKQLRVSIESNGDIDIAWTLNVSNTHQIIIVIIVSTIVFSKAIE